MPETSANTATAIDCSATPPNKERMWRTLAPVMELMRDIVRDGIADGTFRGGDSDELVGLVGATLEGYPRRVSDHTPDQVDGLAEFVTRMLLHGLTGPDDQL